MAGGRGGNEQRQVAALPLRLDADGEMEVLLVTSRRTGRWVLPKGNLMKGMSDAKAAALEAEEEAGVHGHVRKAACGRYEYWKRRSFSFELCRVDVFPLVVTRESRSWKEQDQRRRSWVPLKLAWRMVLEPGLQSILRDLQRDGSLASLLGAEDKDALPGEKRVRAA